MASACGGGLLTHLSQVPDPRGRKGRRHSLSAMLTAVVCGILCGNRGDSALVEWLHDLPVDVWHWMGDTRRPPKLDGLLHQLTEPPASQCPTIAEAGVRSLGRDRKRAALRAR